MHITPTPNKQLMDQAHEVLKGRWGLPIGTFLLHGILVSIAGSIPFPGGLAGLIVGGPFALGAAIFALALSRHREARLEMIFQGFNRFTTSLVAYLLIVLYVFLWSLLLIVPGIIAALSYSMTWYIIADDPAISGEDAMKKSKAMMDGYKAKLFYLFLRFIPWVLLCILTLGIGFLWFVPWAHVTMAKFYDDIRNNPAPAD